MRDYMGNTPKKIKVRGAKVHNLKHIILINFNLFYQKNTNKNITFI